MMQDRPPLVRLEHISKSYGQVLANQDISLDLPGGRILALLGENGAGKSTLMGIVAGKIRPDAGTIAVRGTPMHFQSTKDSIEAGIGMVYQHFMLVEPMTVAENVVLGQEAGFTLSSGRIEKQVKELAAQYSIQIDPAARVGDLSMGEKQRVEILKLLYRQSDILIFDEPTAVLTPKEADALFEVMRSMASVGKAVVFISHKLEEVLAVAHDVAILRRGCIVGSMSVSEVTSKADLARRMVGRDVVLRVDRVEQTPGRVVLEIDGLDTQHLHDVRLQLRQGEILAMVGVAGNGQKPLVEMITGQRVPPRETIRILGQSWHEFYARSDWKWSLSYVPEDRKGLATCPALDLVDNFLITTRQGFTSGPWLNRTKAVSETVEGMGLFNVAPKKPELTARQLSGGNLQKLVLAREFYRHPHLIVAEQPSQGLDIAATEEVWSHLVQAKERAGILLVTGDLNEALSLADRIAVMFRGEVVAMFAADDAGHVDNIGLYMAGMSG